MKFIFYYMWLIKQIEWRDWLSGESKAFWNSYYDYVKQVPP